MSGNETFSAEGHALSAIESDESGVVRQTPASEPATAAKRRLPLRWRIASLLLGLAGSAAIFIVPTLLAAVFWGDEYNGGLLIVLFAFGLWPLTLALFLLLTLVLTLLIRTKLRSH